MTAEVLVDSQRGGPARSYVCFSLTLSSLWVFLLAPQVLEVLICNCHARTNSRLLGLSELKVRDRIQADTELGPRRKLEAV